MALSCKTGRKRGREKGTGTGGPRPVTEKSVGGVCRRGKKKKGMFTPPRGELRKKRSRPPSTPLSHPLVPFLGQTFTQRTNKANGNAALRGTSFLLLLLREKPANGKQPCVPPRSLSLLPPIRPPSPPPFPIPCGGPKTTDECIHPRSISQERKEREREGREREREREDIAAVRRR